MRLKKVLALVLAGGMVIATTACGGSKDNTDNETTTAAQNTTEGQDTTVENEDTTVSDEKDTTAENEEDTTEPENIMEWEIKNGTLYISGKGSMIIEIPEERGEDWSIEDAQPWGEQWDDIEKIVIEEGITVVQSNSFMRDDELLRVDDYLTEVDMADSVQVIGHYAFALQEELTTVNFSDNIEYIGQYAFYCCDMIKELNLPANLKKIDEYAFCGLGIKELTLPEGLEKIGKNAFDACYSLESVYISESVAEIGEGAFSVNLKTIYGKTGSAAEAYANANGIEFIAQ